MSYSTSNPPRLIVAHGLSGADGGVWRYSSTDAHTDVDAAGYFTDGGKLGMRVGDTVIVVKSDTGATTLHTVTQVTTDVAWPHAKGPTTISAAVLS